MNKFMRRSSSSTSLSTKSNLLPMITRNNNKTMMMNNGRQHHLYHCKKHPKHRQSPGVCSLCLSDKLSKVSSSPTTSRYAVIKARARAYHHYSSSSSLSDYDSSDASSAAASPSRAATAALHRRIASDVRSSSRAMEAGEDADGATLFSKSKSMAHVGNKEKKKNAGVSKIWTNLLRLGKNDQKRVNVEDIDRNKMLVISQQQQQQQTLPSSSSMVVY